MSCSSSVCVCVCLCVCIVGRRRVVITCLTFCCCCWLIISWLQRANDCKGPRARGLQAKKGFQFTSLHGGYDDTQWQHRQWGSHLLCTTGTVRRTFFFPFRVRPLTPARRVWCMCMQMSLLLVGAPLPPHPEVSIYLNRVPGRSFINNQFSFRLLRNTETCIITLPPPTPRAGQVRAYKLK